MVLSSPVRVVRSITSTNPSQALTAVTMLATSLLLLGGIVVALPDADANSRAPVIDPAPEHTVSALLDGPADIIRPLPEDDQHGTSVIVNHRRPGVDVEAQLANGEGLEVATPAR